MLFIHLHSFLIFSPFFCDVAELPLAAATLKNHC